MSYYYESNTCECCQPTYNPCIPIPPICCCPITILNNAGLTGENLVVDGTGPILSIKSLVQGTGIVLDNSPTGSITISSVSGDVTLENAGTTGENLVFKSDGPDLEIKSLVQGTGIVLDNSPTGSITISSVSGDVTLENAGTTGENLVFKSDGPNLEIKSLVQGTGIIISNSPTGSITISQNPEYSNVTIDPSGSGTSLVNDGTGPEMEIKTLNQGQGILINDLGALGVELSANISLSSTGDGEDLVITGTGASLVIKTINAGTGIVITDFGYGGLEIATDVSNNTTLAKLGTGEDLVVNGAGPSLTIKGLTGINGSLITSTQNLGSTGIPGVTTPIGPNTIGIGPTIIFGTWFCQCTVNTIDSPGTNNILYLPNMSGVNHVGPIAPNTSSNIAPRNEYYFIAPFSGRVSCVAYGLFDATSGVATADVELYNAQLLMWKSNSDRLLMRRPGYLGDAGPNPNVVTSGSAILDGFNNVSTAATGDSVRIQFLDPSRFQFNAGDYLMFGLGNPTTPWGLTSTANLFFSFIVNYSFNSKVLTYTP